MPVRLTEKSKVVVELPMMMFLRLADGDGKMTAREMERFDRLLASRDWCKSPLLRRSLANTEAEKPDLWKQYTAGELRATIDQVAASLDTVLQLVGAGRASGCRARPRAIFARAFEGGIRAVAP